MCFNSVLGACLLFKFSQETPLNGHELTFLSSEKEGILRESPFAPKTPFSPVNSLILSFYK